MCQWHLRVPRGLAGPGVPILRRKSQTIVHLIFYEGTHRENYEIICISGDTTGEINRKVFLTNTSIEEVYTKLYVPRYDWRNKQANCTFRGACATVLTGF
ncbi:uncharacterized protein LOC112213946 isoform X2 [Bombus impatiens]|uniref:Uncharacterized protein LOC112213946 isoform X2 n=1 Tax=Bombus impatiens TaxID=132113 RepID=A0A6P6FJN4_BOMIM|nr:uncharacterized protein LOC112213946 isoform X2 [Bombus impatiens]